jgi:hypothetical protein
MLGRLAVMGLLGPQALAISHNRRFSSPYVSLFQG